VTAGKFVDTTGHVLGDHDGIDRFTIGQRKGLGIAAGSRRYVLQIVPGSNEVVLGDRDELLAGGLVASRVNWLCPTPTGALRCLAKIRYRHTPTPATVHVDGDGATVTFDEPQSAVTPGQAVVFYDGTRVLGGGWIESARLRIRPLPQNRNGTEPELDTTSVAPPNRPSSRGAAPSSHWALRASTIVL